MLHNTSFVLYNIHVDDMSRTSIEGVYANELARLLGWCAVGGRYDMCTYNDAFISGRRLARRISYTRVAPHMPEVIFIEKI